jgi:hypothetical protein
LIDFIFFTSSIKIKPKISNHQPINALQGIGIIINKKPNKTRKTIIIILANNGILYFLILWYILCSKFFYFFLANNLDNVVFQHFGGHQIKYIFIFSILLILKYSFLILLLLETSTKVLNHFLININPIFFLNFQNQINLDKIL